MRHFPETFICLLIPYSWISHGSFRTILLGIFESYKMPKHSFSCFTLLGILSFNFVKFGRCNPSLQEEGTEPPMHWWALLPASKGHRRTAGIHESRKKGRKCRLWFRNYSNSLSKRHQKITLNHYLCQWIKERFGKHEREMGLIAKCYRRFLQPPSPSPERQTSRDSQDYF